MSLKYKEKLCTITMNNDAKFEEEPMCRFKTNMKNLKNVDPDNSKVSKICTLMDSFQTKYIMFEL